MILENKHHGTVKQDTKEALIRRHCKRSYIGAQLTTERACQGLQGSRNLTYRSQRFCSEVVLTKDCIVDIKDKEYATEVVTIAEKLPLDGFTDIKDSLGEAQNQRDNDKETKGRRQSQEGS